MFAQGDTVFARHRCSSDAHLVFSSAHSEADLAVPKPRFLGARYRILSVARLDAVKNQAMILRALAVLESSDPGRWEAVFVGQGSQRAALEMLARELGLSNCVRFTGQIGHGIELWRQYDSADVFVLSSRSEGTPKVVLEAMCRAVPLIATAVSGVPSQLGANERGLLCEDNSHEMLARLLRDVAEQSVETSSRVLRGLEFAKKNTVESVTSEMLEIVSDWVRKRGGF